MNKSARKCLAISIILICSIVLSSCKKEGALQLDSQLRERYRSPILFEILGYIDDYMGRTINTQDLSYVNFFYSSEKNAADKFEVLLTRFKEQYNIQTQIVRDNGEHHTYFYSCEIAHIVNSCYKPIPGPYRILNAPDSDSSSICYDCALDESFFDTASEEEMLCYLKGAYSRNGEKNSFRFANSVGKFYLIDKYLFALGCFNIKTMTERYIPTSLTIVFKPSKEVEEFLNINSYCDIVIQEVDPNDYLIDLNLHEDIKPLY